jgi:phospholipid/cholesterol/gamma-HCH transport system substrate-binding protein
MTSKKSRLVLAAVLVVVLVAGIAVVFRTAGFIDKIRVTGYFANSNGIFVGDEVRILGVPVGKIDKIEPQADRVRIDFWYDRKYKVPADAMAAVIAPTIVSVRAIQLTPAYSSGPVMADNATIPMQRTAVPVEFDDLRSQLQRLTDLLQPTEPGGVSTLGSFVNTAAANLKGEGVNIRDTLIKLSQAFSALGDHSDDLFTTIKNLSILVSALQSSQDLLRQLNQNLAATTALISNSPNEIGGAVANIDDVVGDVESFVSDNRETLGTTVDKLAAVTTILNESKADLKEVLHAGAPAFQNFVNIYQPSQGAFTGALAFQNFANPLQFVCGAIQAASRLGAEQSAKLCVQYLAPIFKNRQFNFPPLGENLFVGESARPNEITYSEDRLRPDYIPPAAGASGGTGQAPLPAEAGGSAGASPGPLPPSGAPFTVYGEPADPDHGQAPFVQARVPAPDGVEFKPPQDPTPLPPEPHQTDPDAGLQGIMVPPGAGS